MVQCLLQLRIRYAYFKTWQTSSTKVLKSDRLGLLFSWTTRHCSVKHPFIYAQSLAHAFPVLCWKQMANVRYMFQHATTQLRYIKITQRLWMFFEIPMWVINRVFTVNNEWEARVGPESLVIYIIHSVKILQCKTHIVISLLRYASFFSESKSKQFPMFDVSIWHPFEWYRSP